MLTEKKRFHEICMEYLSMKKDVTGHRCDIFLIEKRYPIIKKSYEILGEKEFLKSIRSENFMKQRTTMIWKLQYHSPSIIKMMDLEVGVWYSARDLKDKLQEVLKTVKIEKTARATDLKLYYGMKNKNKLVDKLPTAGFIITRIKKIKWNHSKS